MTERTSVSKLVSCLTQNGDDLQWDQIRTEISNLSLQELLTLQISAGRIAEYVESEIRSRDQDDVYKNYYQPILRESKTFSIYYSNYSVTTDFDGTKDTPDTPATEKVRSSLELLSTALTPDKQPPDGKRDKAGWNFLCEVNRVCSCEVALLCVMALKKHKLERVPKPTQEALLERLKENKEGLVHPDLIKFIDNSDLPKAARRLRDLLPDEAEVSNPGYYDATKDCWTNL